jgi:hypothetical protein
MGSVVEMKKLTVGVSSVLGGTQVPLHQERNVAQLVVIEGESPLRPAGP